MSSKTFGLRLVLFLALLIGLLWFGSGTAATNYDWEKHTISTWEANKVNCIAAADIDGDGDGDCFALATDLSDLYWFEKTDEGWTKHTITTWQANNVEYISAGDIDGDGDIDLYGVAPSLSDLYWWENDGEQNFTRHTITTWQASHINSISAADIDTDGDTDLFAVAKSLSDIYWWEKTASGWTRHTISTWQANKIECISAGDIDGDGDMDLYAVATELSDLVWWENDGSENFTKHTISTWEANNVNWITAEDYDNDGDCDVIGLATSLADLYIWERTDTGWESKATITTWEAVNVECISAVNLDHLKGPDFYAVATSLSDLFWWENKTDVSINANWQLVSISDSAPSLDFISAADLDDDDDGDLFAYSETNGKLYTLSQDDGEFGSFETEITGLSDVKQIAAGDFNGDDHPDCWLLRQAIARLDLAVNEGNGNFTLAIVIAECAGGVEWIAPWGNGAYLLKPGDEMITYVQPDTEDPSNYTEDIRYMGPVVEDMTLLTFVDSGTEGSSYLVGVVPGRREMWRFVESSVGGSTILTPCAITFTAPEGVVGVEGGDFTQSTFGSYCVTTSASPMIANIWQNNSGGVFDLEPHSSAIDIGSMSAFRVRSFGRTVPDLFILDPNGTSLRFLRNNFILFLPPADADLVYVNNTVAPTSTLPLSEKSFSVRLHNRGTSAVTLDDDDTEIIFGEYPDDYSANLTADVTIEAGETKELVFEKAVVPANIDTGFHNATVLLRGVGYSVDLPLPDDQQVHISPSKLVVNSANSPFIVRGECDFIEVSVESGGVFMLWNNSKAQVWDDLTIDDSNAINKGEEPVYLVVLGWLSILPGGYIKAAEIYIDAGTLWVAQGGEISADKLGLWPNYGLYDPVVLYGPGAGASNSDGGGGGAGYGGKGGDGGGAVSPWGIGGDTYAYGKVVETAYGMKVPIYKGSGGGSGKNSDVNPSVWAGGGRGGGHIRINCLHDAFIDGEITADGEDGKPSCSDAGGGGGSGGAIVLITPNLISEQYTGKITANGGKGGSASESELGGGGGGGGRILIVIKENGGEIPEDHVTKTADPGTPGSGGHAGSPGVVEVERISVTITKCDSHCWHHPPDSPVKFIAQGKPEGGIYTWDSSVIEATPPMPDIDFEPNGVPTGDTTRFDYTFEDPPTPGMAGKRVRIGVTYSFPESVPGSSSMVMDSMHIPGELMVSATDSTSINVVDFSCDPSSAEIVVGETIAATVTFSPIVEKFSAVAEDTSLVFVHIKSFDLSKNEVYLEIKGRKEHDPDPCWTNVKLSVAGVTCEHHLKVKVTGEGEDNDPPGGDDYRGSVNFPLFDILVSDVKGTTPNKETLVIPDGHDEDPGCFVNWNNDDDDRSFKDDLMESTANATSEDDLVAIKLRYDDKDDLLKQDGTETVTFCYSDYSDTTPTMWKKLTVWSSATKGSVVLDETHKSKTWTLQAFKNLCDTDPDGDSNSVTYYVEGVALSGAARDIGLKLKYDGQIKIGVGEAGAWMNYDDEDKIAVTVVRGDLEADRVPERNEDGKCGVNVIIALSTPTTPMLTKLTKTEFLPTSLVEGDVYLRRSNKNIRVWSSPDKVAGSEVLVGGNLEVHWDLSKRGDLDGFDSYNGALYVEGVAKVTTGLDTWLDMYYVDAKGLKQPIANLDKLVFHITDGVLPPRCVENWDTYALIMAGGQLHVQWEHFDSGHVATTYRVYINGKNGENNPTNPFLDPTHNYDNDKKIEVEEGKEYSAVDEGYYEFEGNPKGAFAMHFPLRIYEEKKYWVLVRTYDGTSESDNVDADMVVVDYPDQSVVGGVVKDDPWNYKRNNEDKAVNFYVRDCAERHDVFYVDEICDVCGEEGRPEGVERLRVARCKQKGSDTTHGYYYTEDPDDDLGWLISVAEKTSGIFDVDFNTFGEDVPDIDWNDKIFVLLSPIEPAGCFRPYEGADPWWHIDDPDINKNNWCDVIYIDSLMEQERIKSTVAHELQHAIHSSMDFGEELWVNEGCSEYAEIVNIRKSNVEGNFPFDISDFSLRPNKVSLTRFGSRNVWDRYGICPICGYYEGATPGAANWEGAYIVYAHYQEGALWTDYLENKIPHAGGKVMKDFVADSMHGGLDAVDNYYAGASILGSATEPASYLDWAIANKVNQFTGAPSMYKYPSGWEGKCVATVIGTIGETSPLTRELRDLTSDYISYTYLEGTTGTLEITVEGTSTLFSNLVVSTVRLKLVDLDLQFKDLQRVVTLEDAGDNKKKFQVAGVFGGSGADGYKSVVVILTNLAAEEANDYKETYKIYGVIK